MSFLGATGCGDGPFGPPSKGELWAFGPGFSPFGGGGLIGRCSSGSVDPCVRHLVVVAGSLKGDRSEPISYDPIKFYPFLLCLCIPFSIIVSNY